MYMDTDTDNNTAMFEYNSKTIENMITTHEISSHKLDNKNCEHDSLVHLS